VAISLIDLFRPEYLETVNKITTPALFGEMAFMLYLLIVGVRLPLSADQGKGVEQKGAGPASRAQIHN